MKLVFALAVAMVASVAAPAYSRTQCTCKSVNAVGEGNSSCSTAESNNKCTVDFNQYPPVVQRRAADALRNADPSFSTNIIDRNVDASFALPETRDAQQLADTIILYMTVAVTTQTDGKAALVYDASDLRALISFAKDKRDLFDSLFRKPSRFGRSEQGNHSSGIHFTQAPGCMDVQLPRGLRVMFKAAWSPAAERPRCEVK